MEGFCRFGFWEGYPSVDPTRAAAELLPGTSNSTPLADSAVVGGNDSATSEALNGTVLRDVPPCMQNTVLVWVPCSILLLAGPIYVYYILHTRQCSQRQIPHSKLNVAKTLLSVLLVFLCVVEIVYYCMGIKKQDPNVSFAMLHAPVLRCFAMIVITVIIQLERQAGIRSSGLCFVFWLLHALAALIILQSRLRAVIHESWWADMTAMVTFLIITVLVWIQLILSALVDAWPYGCKQARDPNVSPEESASFLSSITWWWITPLIRKGYKKPLEDSDLWTLGSSNQSQSIVPKFDHQWGKEMTQYKTSKNGIAYSKIQMENGVRKLSVAADEDTLIPLRALQDGLGDGAGGAGAGAGGGTIGFSSKQFEPSLLRALFRCFWRMLLLSTVLKFVQSLLIFINPQLLKALIAFTRSPSQPAWQGYVMAVSMFIVAVVQSLFLHHFFHVCFSLGLRVRSALIDSIYRKALKLSAAARKGSTVGEITNLMSVDAQRLMDTCPQLNQLWSAPFQMCVALYFLWQTLGPSVLAGVAVMVLLIPLNAIIARRAKALQATGMKHKDRRIKLMSELLNGMKVLKLYAWEDSFEQQVLDIRGGELKVLRQTAHLNAVSSFTWSCATFLVSLSTFAVYVLSSPDNVLDAEKAFVSLSLFNILRFPMVMIPQLIATLVQASVSVKRIRDFLKKDELDPTLVNQNEKADNAICIDHATFTWDNLEEPVLENIELKVSPGSLVAIVGSVGSGKTSFLSCMLGEMERLKGKIAVKGSIAYVAQQAWLQNATLKDNILFGKEEDKCFYWDVIRACALERDLELLSGADSTEIGEKGINLSGGQKQRISLARAVYQDAAVYLLDDPLSAVDSHVGKHLFDNVLGPNGLLRMKTRLLVTNAISYLPVVDHIVVLESGRISESGSYKELLEREGAFAHFLKNYLLDEDPAEADAELSQVEQAIKDEIMSHVSVLLEEEFPALKQEECCAARKLELARQLSRQSSHDCPAGTSPAHPGSAPGSVPRPRRRIASQASRTSHDEIDDKEEPEFCTWEERPGGLPDWMRSAKRQVIHEEYCVPPAALVNKVKETEQLMQTEQTQTGKVSLAVFLTYARYIGLASALTFLALMLTSAAAQVGANFWLSAWSSSATPAPAADLSAPRNGTFADGTNVNDTYVTDDDEKERGNDEADRTRDMYLGVYGAIGLVQALAVMLGAFVFAGGRVRAARHLHYDMLHNVLRCPLYFFDTTPIGRLTNRFSKDIDMVDMVIPQTISAWLQTMLMTVSTILVISVSTPYILIVLVPLAIIYYLVQRVYVASSRQLKRLEGVTRSPIYSHFGETIQGAATIRAYSHQDQFIRHSQRLVDNFHKTYYPTLVANRWLSVRLEFVGNTIVLFAALFAVIGRDYLESGAVGLSISYAMSVTSVLNMMVRFNSEVESNIVAVERIKEYAELEREADWDVPAHKPKEAWPEVGHVLIDAYATRYRPGLDLVLRGVNCDIKGGEKVGIVGRTGAGKSSLTLALFRIIEAAEGSITIDGIPIHKLGLHDLRAKITIIPQEPVLFSGSLRMNIDPVGRHSEEELWAAMQHAHLDAFVRAQPEGLDLECTEGGDNLSVGQRQLVCLARALLRRTRILVLDEATAAMDMETDDLIQATIRTQFEQSTVLTIAHRLNTIMDYTRIMVLDAGVIAEFDSPQNLLAKKDSIFYGMAKDAGLAE